MSLVPAAAGASIGVRLSAAASTAVEGLLHGPARPAELLGSFPAALYLRTSAGIVAVISSGAVRLPNAVSLTSVDHATVGRHAGEAPDRLVVGEGGVRVGEVEIVVGRWWNPVPTLRADLDAAALTGRLDELSSLLPPWPDADHPAAGRLAAGRDVLSAALGGTASPEQAAQPLNQVAREQHRAVPQRDRATSQPDHARRHLATAAHQLVGLGPGLTPAGDDLLAGTVAALVIFGRTLGSGGAVANAAQLAGAVESRAPSTTPLAADLARYAAAGAVAEPVAVLCRVLAGRGPIRPAIEQLLSIGHTSGRDLAEGVLIGCRAVVAGTTRQPLTPP